MDRTPIARPADDEYPPGIQRYLDAVDGEELMTVLEGQLGLLDERAGRLTEEKAGHRYDEGKWSVKEVLTHIGDSERIFAYRALRIARGDETPLPGFDENHYAAQAQADRRPIGRIVEDLRNLRRSTVDLFGSFDPETLDRRGVANARVISVRAIGWMIAGHFAHHLEVLRSRYGV